MTTTDPPAIRAMTTGLESVLVFFEFVLGWSEKRESKRKSLIDANTTDPQFANKLFNLPVTLCLYSTKIRRQPSFPDGFVDTWWPVES